MSNDDLFALQANMQSIKRSEEVSDLVGAVSFLASEDAAFITGQTLYVNGGITRTT
jgi:NAD(P)-dependent dehydrogenase (short-subunit alcohol dehydrogenase family)